VNGKLTEEELRKRLDELDPSSDEDESKVLEPNDTHPISRHPSLEAGLVRSMVESRRSSSSKSKKKRPSRRDRLASHDRENSPVHDTSPWVDNLGTIGFETLGGHAGRKAAETTYFHSEIENPVRNTNCDVNEHPKRDLLNTTDEWRISALAKTAPLGLKILPSLETEQSNHSKSHFSIKKNGNNGETSLRPKQDRVSAMQTFSEDPPSALSDGSIEDGRQSETSRSRVDPPAMPVLRHRRSSSNPIRKRIDAKQSKCTPAPMPLPTPPERNAQAILSPPSRKGEGSGGILGDSGTKTRSRLNESPSEREDSALFNFKRAVDAKFVAPKSPRGQSSSQIVNAARPSLRSLRRAYTYANLNNTMAPGSVAKREAIIMPWRHALDYGLDKRKKTFVKRITKLKITKLKIALIGDTTTRKDDILRTMMTSSSSLQAANKEAKEGISENEGLINEMKQLMINASDHGDAQNPGYATRQRIKRISKKEVRHKRSGSVGTILGMRMFQKEIQMDEGKVAEVSLFSLTGSDQWRHIVHVVVPDACVLAFMFSCEYINSLNNVKEWYRRVARDRTPKSTVVLVGTHCSSARKKLSSKEWDAMMHRARRTAKKARATALVLCDLSEGTNMSVLLNVILHRPLKLPKSTVDIDANPKIEWFAHGH